MAGAPLALLDALTDGGDFFRARFAARLTPMPGLGLRRIGELAESEVKRGANLGVERRLVTVGRESHELGKVLRGGAVGGHAALFEVGLVVDPSAEEQGRGESQELRVFEQSHDATVAAAGAVYQRRAWWPAGG